MGKVLVVLVVFWGAVLFAGKLPLCAYSAVNSQEKLTLVNRTIHFGKIQEIQVVSDETIGRNEILQNPEISSQHFDHVIFRQKAALIDRLEGVFQQMQALSVGFKVEKASDGAFYLRQANGDQFNQLMNLASDNASPEISFDQREAGFVMQLDPNGVLADPNFANVRIFLNSLKKVDGAYELDAMISMEEGGLFYELDDFSSPNPVQAFARFTVFLKTRNL